MAMDKRYGKREAPGFRHGEGDFSSPLTSAPAAGDLGAAPVTGDFGAFDEGPQDPGLLLPKGAHGATKKFVGTRK